jgi:transcriptional regulator with XRE-family HTH domain
MEFNERVTLVREEKSLSRADFAALVGTSVDLIGKYERGETIPPLFVALKIAEVLDCSLDYLVGITDNSEKEKEAIPGRLKPLFSNLVLLSPADITIVKIVTEGLIARAKLNNK